MDLTLLAKDNYKENEGKGAVDLSWEQTDHNNKTYLIYQRLEDGAGCGLIVQRISTAERLLN